MLTILSRRSALKAGSLGLMAIAGLKASDVLASALTAGEEFTLPPLPYEYDALEPNIDKMTMEIHHDKHHAGYVKNLNAALQSAPDYKYGSIGDILSNLNDVPESIRTAVRNNGGGHANHSLFWVVMSPKGGGEPKGAIAKQIESQLGGFGSFKEAFTKAATTRFGSGWAWLVAGKGGKLAVTSTPNQDTPLSEGLVPLLGLDVWEHAYYLKYQNKRADYVAAWWNTVNWDEVNRAHGGGLTRIHASSMAAASPLYRIAPRWAIRSFFGRLNSRRSRNLFSGARKVLLQLGHSRYYSIEG